MDKLDLTHSVGITVDRARSLKHELHIIGYFHVSHYNCYGQLLGKYVLKNTVKNEGKNLLLNVMFHGTSPVATWYAGLIDATAWTAEVASDTLASHSGWTEFNSYSGGVRITWTEGATSGGSITNSTPLTFAITADATLKGILIASVNTGTAGTLWSTADFPAPIGVHNGDSFKVTYTVAV